MTITANQKHRASEWALHCWSLTKAGDDKALAQEHLPPHVYSLLKRMLLKEQTGQQMHQLAEHYEQSVDQLMEVLISALEVALQDN